MNLYAELAIRVKADLDYCLEQLKDTYLTDKTVPLDERWATYEKVAEMLPIEPWVCNDCIREVLGDISLYDDFYIERYTTVRYVNIVEGMLEEADYFERDSDPENEPRYTKEQIEALQECVLASGVQGFIHDW